jgi:lipoate-protein ligase A
MDSGHQTAEKNMGIDQQLLLSLDQHNNPILRFYDWINPSATFGYFSSPESLLNMEASKDYGLQLAKRPTGGGLLFHEFDFTFSFLLPTTHPQFSLNTLDNYRLVNQIVANAIQQYLYYERPLELLCGPSIPPENRSQDKELRNFCMAIPTVYDVVSNGRKLAGAAQRRTKLGFLHQGSISLKLPSDDFLKRILLPGTSIADAMKTCSYPLLDASHSLTEQEAVKGALKGLLSKEFTSFLQA